MFLIATIQFEVAIRVGAPIVSGAALGEVLLWGQNSMVGISLIAVWIDSIGYY